MYSAKVNKVQDSGVRLARAWLAAGAVYLAWIALISPALAADRPLYVANHLSNDVSQYTIDPSTGELEAGNPPLVGAGTESRDVAITPDGRFAYVVNGQAVTIFRYLIDPVTGALTYKDSYSAGPADPQAFSAYSISISPDGRSAYVLIIQDGVVGNRVAQFDLDPVTGALSPKEPWTVPAGKGGIKIALTPNGKSAYVTNRGESVIYQYDVDPQTGALSLMTGTAGHIVQSGVAPYGIAVSPDGRYAFVTTRGSAELYQYEIDPVTGELAPDPLAVIQTGPDYPKPYGVAVSPDGQSVYVAHRVEGGMVTQYGLVPLTHELKPKSPASVLLPGVDPEAFWVIVSPDGKSAYVTFIYNDQEGGSHSGVAELDISPTGGTLSLKSTPSVESGEDPRGLALVPDRGPTAGFVADSQENPVAFDASASTDPDGTVARYDWDFGDGTNLDSGGPNPAHAYSRSGTYTVTLTVTDNEGCSTKLIYTGQMASCTGSGAATASREVSVDVSEGDELPGDDPGDGPDQGPMRGSPAASEPHVDLPGDGKRSSCKLKITYPRLSKRSSGVVRASRGAARRLLTRGVRGYLDLKAGSEESGCDKVTAVLLRKRGHRYYLPGTRIRIRSAMLKAKALLGRGIRSIRRRRIVGPFRARSDTATGRTRIVLRPFNSRSRAGRRARRRALARLRRSHRVRYVLIYVTSTGGRAVKGEMSVSARGGRWR